MHRRLLGTAVTAAMMLAVAGPTVATASVAPPTKVASLYGSETPGLLVDAKGTVLITYMTIGGKPDQYGDRFAFVRVARKPKGAKKFTSEKLPGETTNDEPYLFEPSKGVLELLATGNGGSDPVMAWRSTNDGVTWKTMDTSALNDPALRSAGVYISTYAMSDAAAGPIMYAGDTGDPAGEVVQFNNALTKVTKLATNSQTLYVPQFGQSANRTTFQVGVSGGQDPSIYPFEVDAPGGAVHTGVLKFPTCKTGEDQNFSLAVGTSVAVVTQSSCGHIWSKTLSTSGAIGKTVKIAVGPAQDEWTNVVADTRHHFTAVFGRPGGDTGVAHSANGTRWSTTNRSVPTAETNGIVLVASLSHGSATWLGFDQDQSTHYPLLVTPLTNSYPAPKPPSSKGIPHAKHGVLGSLAVTAPGSIATKSFRPHGRSKVKVVSSVAGSYTVGVQVQRIKKSETLDLCGGDVQRSLRPGRSLTVTLSCSSSGVVIGGTASPRVDVKSGDVVTFTFTGRNGTLTVVSKIQ